MEFARELHDGVLSGDITVSVRLWKRPKVRVGGRYRIGPGLIEVDSIELVPFGLLPLGDVEACGEEDREALRRRAAHAGPIGDDTLVYRVAFHLVQGDGL